MVLFNKRRVGQIKAHPSKNVFLFKKGNSIHELNKIHIMKGNQKVVSFKSNKLFHYSIKGIYFPNDLKILYEKNDFRKAFCFPAKLFFENTIDLYIQKNELHNFELNIKKYKSASDIISITSVEFNGFDILIDIKQQVNYEADQPRV